MIFAKDHKTGNIFDPWGYLGPKRRKLLDESWAGLFREHLLTELPIDKIAPFFHDDFGRPTKEIFSALGAILLQQTNDLSDEDTIFQLAFNEAWHYALDITDESDAAKYFCLKTISNLRKIVIDNNLADDLFGKITGKLAEVFEVDTSKQRIDSVHIKSNMRRLGRLGIFVKSINKFLVNLERHHRELFDALDEELVARYFTKKALGCFSFVKPSESAKTLAAVAADLFELVRRFADDKDVTNRSSYKLLARVLDDQCEVAETGGGDEPTEVSPKAPKEVPSDSLQNPSDPDAAYSGHKGQGYQVQIMETYCDDDDEQVRAETLNLITHVEVEPANESDANALIPAIESAAERGLAPEELLADSLYGSDENCEAAEKMGVDLVAPTMGRGSEKKIELADFEFSDNGEVAACPEGQAPVRRKTNSKSLSVGFDSEICNNCPRAGDCPVKPGKKRHYLSYDDKALRLALRRAVERTPEFKDRYRWRAGVEATMSEYDRNTGVKQLLVRGLSAVTMFAKLKALGINILRATCARKARNSGANAPTGAKSALAGAKSALTVALYHAISVVKDRFAAIRRRTGGTFAQFASGGDHELKTAV
jgi:hypothetical protein